MSDRRHTFLGEAAEQLFDEARGGCEVAMDRLFKAARDYLRMAARNAVDSDVRGQFSESDLVQETLMAANRGFAKFDGQTEQQFLSWLRRIFVNNLLNQYRAFRKTAKRDRSKERSIDGGLVANEMIATARSDSPSQLAIANEEQQLLDAALLTLSKEYREVIELRHREHLSFAEIGARLSRSSDAARMLWYRAFEQLSAAIERMSR